MNAVGRVLFVDVGQGSCQVILLGDNRAIVIDAGCSPDLPLRLLAFYQIRTIELLVISHSHDDHAGGAAKSRKKQWRKGDPIAGLLVQYRRAINRIAYVADSEFVKRPVGQYLLHLMKAGDLRPEQLVPFVATDTPYGLWRSTDGETALAALSPLGGHHLQEHDSSNPNASSAIIELRHRGQKIVFAADSEYQQWRDIYRLRGDRTLNCKALTMPHHGGLMQGTQSDLDWFASKAISPEVIVVSVATKNSHYHPRPEVIQAFSSRTSHIMCTQVTEQCCIDLESLRPAVSGSLRFPCRSSAKTLLTGKKKRSAHVACAGTISALLVETGIAVEHQHEHRQGIDRLIAETGKPTLCRIPTDEMPNVIS